MPKIREAQLDKVPYMVIVGQKEIAAAEISVRRMTEYQAIFSQLVFHWNAGWLILLNLNISE